MKAERRQVNTLAAPDAFGNQGARSGFVLCHEATSTVPNSASPSLALLRGHPT